MPTIEASKKDLLSLIGKKLNDKELALALQYAKSEFSGENNIKIEIADVNQPDLLSIEGIARQCKLGLKIISGLQKYEVKKSNYKISANSKTRPLIAAAVVKNIKFSDESIKQIIQLQEKLCEIFGKKRKEAALGIYDFDKISWPILYADYKPEDIRFIPLEETKEMNAIQILNKHPTGISYKHLLENEKFYPLLADSKKQILSMPPIINSNYSGKVTEKTKNVFIEVTGYNYRFILPVLNTVVTALAERGGKIEEVKINNFSTPDLSPREFSLDLEEINSVLGLNLNSSQAIQLLKKAGYNASGNKKIKAVYPAYRQDIMDSRDIIEDIAIAYGYNKISPVKPVISSEGGESEQVLLSNKIADLLVGLGFQEIATPTLTSKEILFKKMNKKPDKIIEVENPVSELYCVMRQELLSSALNFLSKNVDSEYPQKIFEIGNTINEKGKDELKLVVASTHSQANFTELKQILQYLEEQLQIKLDIKETTSPEFIEGRAGKIIKAGKELGIIGEIHPQILKNWHLKMPVSCLEICLDDLI